MTPEGKAKKKFRESMQRCCAVLGYTYWMQGQAGSQFGVPGLDYIGTVCPHGWKAGTPFAVELKRFDGKGAITERQRATAERMRAAGIRVFFIDTDAALGLFVQWLGSLTSRTP